MKKIFSLISLIIIAFLTINVSNVLAAGTATLSYSGPSTASVGENITIELKVSNIVGDPLAAIGTKVIFDSEYLQYVSSTGTKTPYEFFINENNFKLAGYKSNPSAPYISNDQVIFTFVFKALKEGTTKISFSDQDISDSKSSSVNVTTVDKIITIGGAKSSNNFLSSLTVGSYTLTPAFDKNKTDYTLNVGSDVNSVIVNATKEDSKATITGTGTKNLSTGANKITVTVTAENGSKRNYNITINKAAAQKPASSDSSLKDLSVSGYQISPAFKSEILEYDVTVPASANEITIDAIKNDNNAKVEIVGNKDLKDGSKVNVIVTAEDGTKTTYTINVKKSDTSNPTLDSDATLKSLYIGGYTLNPIFNKNTNVYSISVGESVTGLKVEGIANSDKAKVEISGNLGWQYGMNTVLVTVTAENGNKNTYIINVNRENPNQEQAPNKSQENYLTSLEIPGVNINPIFDKLISNYTATVPYETENLEINYNASGGAKVEIIGNNKLNVGNNNIQIKVTAEDGSIRIYTVNVTRSSNKSNTNLKSLIVDKFDLSPKFNANILDYKIKVNHNTDSLVITAIPEDSNATVEIIGNDNLRVGDNTILVKVTDSNGFTKIYELTVTKEEFKILGLPLNQLLLFGGLLLLLLFLILLLLRRNKKEEPKQQTPIIDFKPEFNIGSRNNTDDDVVQSGANLNQGNLGIKEPKLIGEADSKVVREAEIYDPYDDIVTKDEIIDALNESIETKNTDKLKMLLQQEELNRLKEKVKNEGDKYEN